MKIEISKIVPMLLLLILISKSIIAQEQPNVLWIVTDDQRYDAIPAFNKMLHGRQTSELGYVESPNVDKLTEMGTTFINTYCQTPACAPSRASMHFGSHPFRSGVYEFEYHNNNAVHSEKTLPEQMTDQGYETLHIGKLGVRLKTLEEGKLKSAPIYQKDIGFKPLRKDGLTDWGKDWFHQLEGEKLDMPLKSMEFFVTPNGEFEPKYAGMGHKTMMKYDLLRIYNEKKPKSDYSGMILSGVSPREAGKTRDGYYPSIFIDYLQNENKAFTVGSREFEGVNTSKPLFCHIGYDFPHTPVLPPAKYRTRFQKYHYKVPSLAKNELETMSSQFQKQVMFGYSNHFTNKEKQAMIQDYYAFCAYGDELIGQAVNAFIQYSEKKSQEWMIVYVCGDHGWKLNEHGAVSKFTPWEIDTHNPIVVVSSNKEAYPAGKVVREFTEFVDIAPTILAASGANLNDKKFEYLDGLDLQKVASGEIADRDYVVGESHAVTGPRAFIRTKNYVFSMQTRPNKKRGENMLWALKASYEELDPAFYHTSIDPKELKNLAFNQEYSEIAQKMKEKLINIVLGDDRVEVEWGKHGKGTT